MPESIWMMTMTIIALALIFDFINGFHDTANAIATSVATRVLSPAAAITMAAILNFLGAFISVKVAETIGAGLVPPESIPQTAIVAALLGAIIWNLITWYGGLPSSSSHALIGGLLGAAIAAAGSLAIVNWQGFFSKVLLWLVLSPCIGLLVGFCFMNLLNLLLKTWHPERVKRVFSKAQIISAALMAFNHGANDAQKSMGVITMALLSGGLIAQFEVPLWVKAACALAMAAGTSFGGWKIIKTVGLNMARLAPVNGFAAETGAAAVIFTATMFHAPVSTTHIISTSIMGVGAAKRLSSVRWIVAQEILMAWFLTIPITAILSGCIFYLIDLAMI